MTEQDLKDMRELDRLAEEAGGFVSPMFKHTASYNYKKITEYCREKKVDPQDLTLRELKKFVIR